MKFIFEHNELRQYLQSWAGDSELLMARYYFWNAGSELQKSREGLARTLLHQILHVKPELTARLFPKRCKVELLDVILETRTKTSSTWSWTELYAALIALSRESGGDFKLAFFIDGLDEFDGGHEDLVSLIQELHQQKHVKVCTSSRPWNIFVDAFSQNLSLKMQDLTSVDISYFTRQKFNLNKGFVECKELFPTQAEI
jgi:hypothetical protein